jgi:hypothetical protein
MVYESSSEDEFPDVAVILQRRKQKTAPDKVPNGDREGESTRPSLPETSPQSSLSATNTKTPAPARRRRKLGQGQPVGGSLVKPWHDVNGGNGAANRATSSRQASWTRAGAAEASAASAGELLDRFPVKAKHVESRVVSGATTFDSPPEERKKTRRLISRGEKKAQELEVILKEKDWLASSDESGSDTKDYGKNQILMPSNDEDSEFMIENSEIENWDSDSDGLSATPPRRSQSPSGRVRRQRRLLTSSNDSSKTEPARTKSIGDDPATDPKKRPEKQKVSKQLTTKKTKKVPKGNLEDVFEKLKMFVLQLNYLPIKHREGKFC